MSEASLFISDLHLSSATPGRLDCFMRLLDGIGGDIDCLYILGDLFDSYIGDDDDHGVARKVRLALARLTARGIRVAVQCGNRDFLLGQGFAEAAGVELLGDYAVIALNDRRILLTHGDLLCTDDVQYQAVRVKLRSQAWQSSALAKPLWARRCYARWYRVRSHFNKRGKTADIMDVNQAKVLDVLDEYNADWLIHGHTHRPAVHEMHLHGRERLRFVLAEWREQGEVLRVGNDGWSRNRCG